MTLGLFVEGPSDKYTIPILIRKFFPKIRVISIPLPRGEMLSSIKVMAYIKFLLRRHKDTKKILVCRDTHCTDPKEIKEKVSLVEQELKESDIKIKYTLVVHALEGWLMEEKGLRKVLGEKAKIDLPNNPEEICEPEKMLNDIFRKNRKSYQKTRYAPQIAEAVDGKIVRKKSRSFDEFCKTIQDC